MTTRSLPARSSCDSRDRSQSGIEDATPDWLAGSHSFEACGYLRGSLHGKVVSHFANGLAPDESRYSATSISAIANLYVSMHEHTPGGHSAIHSRRRRTSADSHLPALPYLREVSLRTDAPLPINEYPFRIPAVKNLGTLPFASDVTFLVGENGTGKSTLLEAIAVAVGMNPEGGGRNFNFATRESHSPPVARLKAGEKLVAPAGPVFPASGELLQRRQRD